jgi:DNA-binding NarL/FixJ family response regulator
MPKLRLVVADDNPQTLQALVSLLEVEFEVVATAADGRSALAMIRHWKPDVVVLDLKMPGSNGIEVTRELAKQPQSPPVVICSVETDSGIVETALRAGVTGYVFQERMGEDLVPAVRLAYRGRSFVSGKNKAPDHAKFFKDLGRRIRALREQAGYSHADMNAFGFSTRHWQQIEAGRPTTTTTLLRICRAFKIKSEDLLRGLERDI